MVKLKSFISNSKIYMYMKKCMVRKYIHVDLYLGNKTREQGRYIINSCSTVVFLYIVHL